MSLDPVYRSADEVILPTNAKDLMGWTDGTVTEDEALDFERASEDRLVADLPAAFAPYQAPVPSPEIQDKWVEFQKSKGRYEGSCDISILDEFVEGTPLNWLRQIIGSCVMSNTFPVYVIRQMFQIALLGYGGEYFGRDEFGKNNYGPYGPMTYGMARRRANMRGGDGLYCEPMLESLMKDGVLPCSDPNLVSLLQRLGFADDRDFPEPQGNDGARLYRDFGKWQHLDSLKEGLTGRVLKGRYIKSADELMEVNKKGIPAFVCSMEAIHKVGTHRDGFAIHARNPRDQWAHNMNNQGFFIASDGEVFFRWGNTSWGPEHMYNRKFDEVEASFRARRLTMATIEEIELPSSPVPTF